ncbi:alpha-L-fucosidase [Chitinophaga barathri]|uniref:alpha-L-fucosidase n=1 Tax=Chitinophaga barathri TaxID=1647451 RepID=A0A3N4MNQ8_9BACT|nr:alpha-L-fucosidase [Chitinophaga barathri]RPD41299.1 alpha-L-fucosidase [Chitinophaga barathri]
MKKIILAACMLAALGAQAQNEPYVKETDPLVLRKLDEWQDWKFGLMMHWGTYSQWGVVESWSICPEDEGWTQRKPAGIPYYEYVQKYEALAKTFNPVKFDPAKWAAAAKRAGMKYMVFTTKHHDGFNMFDTKQSDYKITSPNVPFSKDPRADVTKETFNAFRKEGIHIGAYFSKPDWHVDSYWWSYFPPKDRNPSYEIAKYPERWKSFQDFTYKQIEELMTGYGKVDILWLDGGWVRPLSMQTKESLSWSKTPPQDQDINMAGITAMARKNQPGLIVVDRSVHGPFENYRTPEQSIPDKPLDYPWETCMTMAGSWSYVPNDQYKPVNKILHNLVDIVAKGGNYLLNVGPGPDGAWHDEAYRKLDSIGAWMNTNGEAIYGTRYIAPYKNGKVCFTQKKDGSAIYAIYLLDAGEQLPSVISFAGISPKKGAKMELLGYKGKLSWKQEGENVDIRLPGAALKRQWADAVAIRIQ